ncbi:hypothetical protein BJX61DRAFT_543221 [Aspergillus egyptiacus]|nr:hypothetical protein BJX61DRAFT_543221 [Aspergillus egyptiacus]
MAGHGVTKHGRYERLSRKHRLEPRPDDGQQTLDRRKAASKQKSTRTKNLHDEWAAHDQKRQQVESPSRTAVRTDPQTMTTSLPLSTRTTQTSMESGSKTATTAALVSEGSPIPNEETSRLLSTESVVAPIVATDIESAAESATTTSTSETATAFTKDETADSLSVTPPTAATAVALTEATTVTAPSGSSSESLSGSLSESYSETLEITATNTAEAENFAITQDLLPILTSTSTSTATISTSVPIISQPSENSHDSISLSSNPDIPTAVISVQTTSTETSLADILSDGSSSSDSDTGTTSTTSPTTTTTITSSSDTSTTTTTTYFSSQTTYSDSPSQGDYGWGGGTSENTGAEAIPEPTGGSGSDSGSDSGSGSDTSSPQSTGKIVGGVVGGVAGAAIILLLIFLFLRRRRKAGVFLGLSTSRSAANHGDGGLIRGDSSRQMVSRDSNNSFGAAYFAPAFMKRWRQSQLSSGEESNTSTTPSEHGFQKISGRKLPSGVQPGYGQSGGLEAGSPPDSDLSPTLPPAIPRSAPIPQPPTSNPFSHPLDATVGEVPEEDVVIMRPSPARTPTAGSSNATAWGEASTRTMPMSFPRPPSGAVAIPRRPDSLGRSHPSYDGSRGSRFTESL